MEVSSLWLVVLMPRNSRNDPLCCDRSDCHRCVLLKFTCLYSQFATTGTKRGFGETFDSVLTAREPVKRRKLQLLPDSKTIYRTEPDPLPTNTPYLPSTGAGFNALTMYPGLIMADKTPYIEILDKEPSYQYLFLRPRRFGKSTFLQMLACYYNKRLQPEFSAIFGDLYIGKHPTKAANSLLVLCFDFSAISPSDTFKRTAQKFHGHVYDVLNRFLNENSAFLLPHKKSELLDKASGAHSLTNVFVRHLLRPCKHFAKLVPCRTS